jgi:hypothetical protein
MAKITVTELRGELFARRGRTLVAHAVRERGHWECFRVSGGNSTPVSGSYAGERRRKDQAAAFLAELAGGQS